MMQFNACFILSLINYNEHIQNYIDMLFKSLYSLNKYYKVDNLYIIISYNEDNKYVDILNKIKFNINNICNNIKNIHIYDININLVNIKYPINNINNYRIDKTALLKFYIPYIVDVDNIFYFDCDIIFYGNVLDSLFYDIKQNTLFKIYNTQIYGVNSGILYINCELYNKLNIIDNVIYYYQNNNPFYVDQSCFSYLINDVYIKNSIIHDNTNYNINICINNKNELENIKFGIYHIWGLNKQLFDILYNFIKNDKNKKN